VLLRSRAVALQLAVSVIALAAVAWWAARQPLPDLPSARTALPGLASALALYTLATLLRGERWRSLLAHGGVRCGRGDAYALTTVGYMANNTLPARAGDVLKALLSAGRTGAPRRDIVGMLVAERMLDVVALGLVFTGLVATMGLPLGVPGWILALVGAGLVGAVAAAWALSRDSARGRRATELAARLLAPTRRLWSATGAALLSVSIALWIVEGAVYAVLGAITGVPLSLLDGLYVMALANLIALVPAAPGYIGTFDAAVVLAVSLLGAAARSAALAYVVVVRFVLFVPITLVGLLALVTRYGGLSAARAALSARPVVAPRPMAPPSRPAARSAG